MSWSIVPLNLEYFTYEHTTVFLDPRISHLLNKNKIFYMIMVQMSINELHLNIPI
jgi:hypothetical protein